MRRLLLPSCLVVICVLSAEPLYPGSIPCGISTNPSGVQYQIGFPPYRHGPSYATVMYRDLEFLWDSLYTGGINSDVANTLSKLAGTISDSVANPFRIPGVSDFRLVYEFLRRAGSTYTTIPGDTTSVVVGTRDPVTAYDLSSYNPSDRSHVDMYLTHPTRPLAYGGRYPSEFVSGVEDASTGHQVTDPKPANALSVKGPAESHKIDLTGTGWTRPGRICNVGFNHEFQHSLPPDQGANWSTEMFSAIAEAIGGNSDTTSAPGFAETPYTWSLLSFAPSDTLSRCIYPRGIQSNYQGRSAFAAYLTYNFRGADTSTTLAALNDDLARRWARSAGRNLADLRRLLRNDSCGTCATKQYFNPLVFGGPDPPSVTTMDDTTRLALLHHNWRVATYVNNSFLAEGQYGYPPQFGFSPAHQLKAWQDVDNCATDDLVAIPPEVVLNATDLTRERHLARTREFRGNTYPLILQPLGAEYWVIRSDPALWSSGQDLVVRVSPEGIHLIKAAALNVCPPVQRDARLMASVVGYNPPTAQVASGRLWEHPEWAVRALEPRWVDVDSVAGSLEFTVSSFGDSVKAALVVITLADGPSQYYAANDHAYVEALRYRLDLAVRKAPFQTQNPSPLTTFGRVLGEPAWAPGDTAIAFSDAGPSNSFIRFMKLDGSLDNYTYNQLFDFARRPDWSPRGDRIAFSVRKQGSATEDIYVHVRPIPGAGRFTFMPGLDLWPAFQPNGQRLAYTRRVSLTDSLGQWELRRVDVDGSGDVVLLSRSGAVLRSPRWSPDGNWIWFTAADSLYAVGADGASQGVVVSKSHLVNKVTSFDVSPGSAALLLEQPGSHQWLEQCRNTDGICCSPYTGFTFEPRQMPYRRIALLDTTACDTVFRFYRTGAVYRCPRWSRNGTRIAYSSTEFDGAGDVLVGQVSYNHAPLFASASLADAEVAEGFPVNFGLSAADPDGEAVTYEAVYLPPGATLSPVGYFSWPYPSPLGAEYYVVFRALDSAGGADHRVVKYTVIQGQPGGCPYIDTRTASGWQVENSILSRSLTGTLGVDAYRLKTTPAMNDGRYQVRLRENEQELTTLDQVGMVTVDHPPGTRSYYLGGEVVVGNRVPAVRVTRAGGEDITALINGSGSGYQGQPGDTLLVQLTSGTSGTFGSQSILDCLNCPPGVLEGGEKEEQALWRPNPETRARPAGAAYDQAVLSGTGILLQVSDGQGGWRTVKHHYPRAHLDEATIDSVTAGQMRLVFVGRHRVTFIGRLERSAGGIETRVLGPVVATHSRLGNVRGAVSSVGGLSTVLAPNDTLTLEFNASPLPAGWEREWFVLSNGVYTSALPSQLEPVSARQLPARFALRQNQPNPFATSTTIAFDLPVTARVRLEVFDLSGRRIRALVEGEYPAGSHSVTWDHRGNDGAGVRPGIYVYRLAAGPFREQKKMVLLP